MTADLRRRLRALEKQQPPDPFAELMRRDPRWADPAFREHVREWERRLQHDERTLQQIRQATRELAAELWESSGDHDRAASVRQGFGEPAEECRAALLTLDPKKRAQFRAALQAVLSDLERRLPTA